MKNHNTVLLANHGIICWGGHSRAHAEWFVEVTDTYCWTLMLANQLGSPITHISPMHNEDLLKIKKTLGLPDARHEMKECRAVRSAGVSGRHCRRRLAPYGQTAPAGAQRSASSSEVEAPMVNR